MSGRLAAAGCALALLAPAAAGAKGGSVQQRLGRALRSPSIAATDSAAMAVDLATGRSVFAHNTALPLEPASNEKLAVTYGALTELGPGYRFRTQVLGEGQQVGSVWEGRLVLKGFGDPTLDTGDLERLVHELYAQGIRRVTGHVAGDASFFDDRWTAPGWKPGFYGIESPPLSALVVNRAARRGKLVANPPLAAAALFDRLLRAKGIDARDAVAGAARPGAQVLAVVHSKTLANLLPLMDGDSDNFTAEMVLKAIGAERGEDGTTARGAQLVRRDLAAAGVPLAGVRIADGSGLSQLDRVTAQELASLLLLFWRSPSLHPIVLRALAVAGESGTLEHRLTGRRTRGVVRGKTGTTDVASALSGYAGSRYAFVLVENGHPVNWAAAHTVQDAFVTTLVARAARPR